MNELRQALVSRYIKDVLLPNSMDGYTGPAQIADNTINVIESDVCFPVHLSILHHWLLLLSLISKNFVTWLH